MSVITGREIRRRITDALVDDWQRLVVTPLLDDEQLTDSEASIDLRLGTVFLAFRPGQLASIDWSKEKARAPLERVVIPMGGSFVVHPGQFILAQTLEFVRLPTDLMAYVVTRSTWGRTGMMVATAVGIQPGFAGVITLELRNLGDVPVNLWPGSRILQLFLHEAAPAAVPSVRSYTGSIETVPPKPKFDSQLTKFTDFAAFPLKPLR